MNVAFEKAAEKLRNAKTKEEADAARREVRAALYPHSEKGEEAPRLLYSESRSFHRRRGRAGWQ